MEDNTVWRLTTEDFEAVIKDNYPDMAPLMVEKVIAKAHSNFEMPEWTEYVDGFIQATVDGINDTHQECDLCNNPVEIPYAVCSTCEPDVGFYMEGRDVYKMTDGSIRKFNDSTSKYDIVRR